MTSSIASYSIEAPGTAQPLMLARRDGRRFAMLHLPAAADARGAIVYIHPFAEEMNKSRRAAALAARSFSRIGWAVLQLDLLGCGDSSGEFEDASWDAWVDDVVFGIDWLQERTRCRPLLWSIRSGSLLASAALSQAGNGDKVILWQPALSGQATVTQFLRLRVAADAFAGAAQRNTTTTLRANIAGGEAVEVAGYRLTAALIQPLDVSELRLTSDRCSGGLWLEAAAEEDATLAPAGQATVDRMRQQGVEFKACAVRAEAFWQSTETAIAPELVDATCAYLNELAGKP